MSNINSSGSDQLAQMLKDLSAVKGLNTAPPATTAQAVRQNAQLGLRDYALTSIQNAPNLSERITQIASGKPQPSNGLGKTIFGNPVAKTLLGALAVYDTPRRAVISGIREIADVLDSDPNTQAKFSDFITHTKDPAYGFGTAFPISGWKGRIIGAFGDILLDPIAMANLGTKVGSSLIEGTELATKTVFGKHLVGAEARAKLASQTVKEMRNMNLVDGVARFSEEEIQKIGSQIASKGKKYIPTEIATKFNIPKPGIYYFGNRVRVPMSGPIADALESGITKMRLGIATSRPGEAILNKITRTGVGGALAPLSASYVKDARRGLATGALRGKAVTDALRLLSFDENRRIATQFASQKAEQALKPLFSDERLLAYRGTISKLLDNPTEAVLASASVGERAAADDVRKVLEAMHVDVATAMKAIDPGFRIGKVTEYFPWTLSDDALKAASEERSVVAERILKYSKIDVNDVSGSFKSRNLKLGDNFFGTELTPELLNAHSMNDIARKELGFDMFETDALKVLAKYSNHYAEQMGNAAFFTALKSEPDMMDFIKTNFQMSPEFLDSLDEGRAVGLKNLDKTMKKAQSSIDSAVKSYDDFLVRAEKRATKNELGQIQSIITDAENYPKALSDVNMFADEMKVAAQELSDASGAAFGAQMAQSGIVLHLQSEILDIQNKLGKIPTEMIDSLTPRAPEALGNAEQMAAGTFAEVTPAFRELDQVQQMKLAKEKVDGLSKQLNSLYDKFQKLNSFHNEFGNINNHIDYAQGVHNGTSFDKALLDSMGYKYYQDVYEKEPIKLTKGKLQQADVRNLWSGAAQENPTIAMVKQKLDPLGIIKQNRLMNMTIDDVKSTLIRSTTTSDNMLSLQEATAWMIAREIKYNPSLAYAIAGGVGSDIIPIELKKGTDELLGRINKLNQLNEQASYMNGVLKQINITPSDLEMIDGAVVERTGTKFNFVEDKEFHDLISQINEKNSQINDALLGSQDLFEKSPLIGIEQSFSHNFGNRTGLMSAQEVDGLSIALDSSGYSDIAQIVDERQGVLTFEQAKQVLAGYKEQELITMSDTYKGTASASQISELKQEVVALEKRKNAIYGSMNEQRRTAHEALQRSGGYEDFVKEYSDAALEMYMYSESSLQFRRIQEVWAPFGMTPDMGIWTSIRSNIAANLHNNAVEFEQSFNKAIDELQAVQVVVQASPAGDQYGVLRDEMNKLFDDPERGKRLRRHFPQFEVILNKPNLAENARLMAAEPEVAAIQAQLQDMHFQLRYKSESGSVTGSGRRTQNASMVTGNARISETDAEKTAGQMRAMRMSSTFSPDALAARIQSGKATPKQIISDIRELLAEGITPTLPSVADDVAKKSVKTEFIDPKDFETVLNSLEQNYERIAQRVKSNQKLARQQLKAAGIASVATSTALGITQKAKEAGITYGFAGSFSDAIRPSSSATKVRNFFGDLIGGTFTYSKVGDVQQRVITTEGREARQAARIIERTFADSYAGKTKAYISQRKSALRNVMDVNFPVNEQMLSENIVPGLSGVRNAGDIKNGPLAYADMLEESATRLIREIAQDENFSKQIQRIGIDIESMRKGIPLTDEQISLLDQLWEQQPVNVKNGTGSGLFRFVDAEKNIIDTLPKQLQDKVYAYREMKINVARIQNDEFMPTAQADQLLHRVIAELAPLDLHLIHDATGAKSFDPFSTFGQQIWNKGRPGVVDISGNPILNNVDSSLLDTHFANWDKPARAPQGLNHKIYQMEEVPFNANSFTVDKTTGREISGLIFLDKDGVVIRDSIDGETSFQQARNMYNRREPITVLKPIESKGLLESEFINNESKSLQNAKVRSGDIYNPAKTWVFLPSEGAVTDSVSKVIVKDSLPEIAVRLPINQRSGSSMAFSHPVGINGRPLSFTPQETKALFSPPIVKDELTVSQLEKQIEQLEKQKPTISRYSSKKDKALVNSIDKKIEPLKKAINDIFERPIDVKQIPQLQREIKDLEAKIPQSRLKARGGARKEMERIFHEIEIRQMQIDAIRARPSAEAKVQTMINLVTDNADIAYHLGLVKRYGDLPDDPVKAIRKMVSGMIHSTSPDGIPVGVAEDAIKLRKSMVSSKFQSSYSGQLMDELTKAESEIKQTQFAEFRNDVKTKLGLIGDQQREIKNIRNEWDAGSQTADLIESIQTDIKNAGKDLINQDGGSVFTRPAISDVAMPERSITLLRSDIRDAESEIRSLQSQKNSFTGELNKLSKLNNLTEDQLARIDEITSRINPSFDARILEKQQLINGAKSTIDSVGRSIDTKTVQEVLQTAEQIKNAKLNNAVKYVRGSKETLTKVRMEFGELSPQYRTYRDLLIILTSEKTAFDELQAAQKTMSSIISPDAARSKFRSAAEAYNQAKTKFDMIAYSKDWAETPALANASAQLENVKLFRNKLATIKNISETNLPDAIREFDLFVKEAEPIMESLNNGSIPENLRMILTHQVETATAYHAATLQYGEANTRAMVAKGIDMMYKNMKPPTSGYSSLPWAAPIGTVRKTEDQVINGVEILKEFNKGWVAIGEKFPNMQISPELAEIFNNGHRLRDPLIVKELSKFLGSYTRFFKAYATLSPGFHVRNSIANGMALFFGGGNPINLAEGLQVSIKWNKAIENGWSWERFLKTLPAEQARNAEVARMSVAASGGGMYSDVANELSRSGRLTTNKVTNTSRKYGELADNHVRFMFGYDAGKQGMDYSMAAARTKRYFVDYMDMSDLDKVMKQIVPFWMWTSRNLPTQITNMWLNPKPYLIYNSIKRNISDDSDSSLVPSYLKEMGAFKLPFGDNLFLSLDTGFTNVDRQIGELRDPARLMQNLNPLLRLPIELAGGRQLYNNRQFSTTPVEVSGGVGGALQPLLQALGMGQTSSTGKKFANDKALYTARSLFPMLGTAERLSPSIGQYADRGTANAWAGFMGSPVKQITPEMQASALAALQRQIQQQVASNNAVEGQP